MTPRFIPRAPLALALTLLALGIPAQAAAAAKETERVERTVPLAAGGTLTLKSAGNVTVEASAPGNLTLKGGTGVKIDAGGGMVELSGSQVKLN